MQPIAELLKKYSIDEIAIVDDFFDPPRREDLGDNISEFWNEIKGNKDGMSEMQKLECKVATAEDLNNEVLRKLWNNRNNLTALKASFDKHILPIKIDVEKELIQFCNFVENDFGIKYVSLGSEDELQDIKYKLIFIDYYLGPIATEALKVAAVRKSTFIASKILEKYKNAPHKPTLILMSSRPVDDGMRNDFRDKANIMGGMFYFISKNDIAEKTKLSLALYQIARALEASYAIENFIQATVGKIGDAGKILIENVRELSISDYAYIQKLSLEKESHPFGDYIISLFGEHFLRVLQAKLKDDIAAVNQLSIEYLPPSEFTPSIQLTEMYQSSLYEFIPEETPLHLGDIYIKDSDVYMVINAQCDLACRVVPGGRTVDSNLSVVLIQGKLIKHTEKDPKDADLEHRTEFIELSKGGKKETYRIAWYLSRVRTMKYQAFDLYAEGFTFVCRLKLPYALRIQNAVASRLTRIGVPVAPPIYSSLKVELFCEGGDGRTERLLGINSDAAHLFFMKEKDMCILTREFVYDLLNKVATAENNIDILLEDQKKRGASDRIKELTKKKQYLKALRENEREQLKLLDPLPLPKVTGENEYSSISITRGKTTVERQQYPQKKHSLWLNIIDSGND